MGIVWHGSTLPNAIHLAEIGNNFVIERPTLIAMDPGRNPKHTKPLLYKNLSHGERLLIGCNKSLTILREGICENKDVLFAPFAMSAFVKSRHNSSKGRLATRLSWTVLGSL